MVDQQELITVLARIEYYARRGYTSQDAKAQQLSLEAILMLSRAVNLDIHGNVEWPYNLSLQEAL